MLIKIGKGPKENLGVLSQSHKYGTIYTDQQAFDETQGKKNSKSNSKY